MSSPVPIEILLKEGLQMMENVDNPQNEAHRELAYWEEGQDLLKAAGLRVYELYPKLNDMIQFAKRHVPERDQGRINHAWDGIGEWVA